MEKILSMIGLAHKAGRVEIGEEPVGSAARAKKARIILVAGDAAASSVRRAMGFADDIAKKLAALDPQRFGSAAERMAVKAQRARERKLEQLAHEKNVRMGKKRPPKPPEKAAPPEKEERREREKKPSRPGKRERGAAARSRQKSQARARFEGSRPVKKGKGSERK